MMMIRKKITLIFVGMAISCGYAEAQPGTYTIAGKLKRWGGTDTLLLTYQRALGQDTVVRLPIIAGRFAYRDSLAWPVRVVLRDNQGRQRTHETDEAIVYLAPGETTRINVKGALSKAKVSGNTFQREYRQLIRLMRRSGRKLIPWRKELMALSKSADARERQGYRELKAKYDHETERLNKQLIGFVDKHPRSIVSLDVLHILMIDGGMRAQSAALYNGLNPAVQETPWGKEVGQRLAATQDARLFGAALDFTSTTPDGQTLSLQQALEGRRLLLIHFWASWSKPSLDGYEALRHTYEAFHRIGFDILGVSLDKNGEQWRRTVREKQLSWRHVSSLKAWDEPVAKLFGITTIPDSFLVDGNGELIAMGLRGEELYAFVRDYLATQEP